MEYLQEKEGGLEPDEIEAGMVIPPPTENGAAFAMSKWVKRIHGRDFVQYEGLLALARLCTKSHSLAVSLWAKWVYLVSKNRQNETKKSLLTWASDF
jgi:hypothetical protein